MGALASKWASVILPLQEIKGIPKWAQPFSYPPTFKVFFSAFYLLFHWNSSNTPLCIQSEGRTIEGCQQFQSEGWHRSPSATPLWILPGSLPFSPPVPKLFPDQHRQRRSLLVTSSEEWTTLGTNPLFTPSQPSWIVISPDRTSAKMSLVSSVKACSTLMASRADVST